MTSRRSSVRLCCVFCALLSGLLWFLISGGVFTTEAVAQEKPTAKKEDAAKPDVTKSEDGRYEFRKEHDPNGQG